MALSKEIGSASSSLPWKYDVFLSFRGEDTRKGFTDHLYSKLQGQGIKTFRDDPELERGTSISPELLQAIEQSRFAIVVLSKNYASSTWCLLELCKIIECMEQRGTILPVFYEVEPSHVRHQRGSFSEAFTEHDEKFGKGNQEVEGWRDALTTVANLAGWSSKDYRYETELIKEIVQALWSKVHPTLSVFGSSEKLVGIDSKVEEIEVLLDKEANDVRFIGIWGMGGMGKTTLAGRVYEKISHQFEVCIFLANVREVCATHGLVHLLKQILSQVLREKSVELWDVYSGIKMVKRCLCNKAVLLVLDDVDQSEQLENLVGEKDWFGLRSRIIITTRDLHVLVTHGIDKPYKVEGLNHYEALELFCWKAFRKYKPRKDYAEISMRFVKYADGLPLALKTLGFFLYKRSLDAWNSALEKLHNTPNITVFNLLEISYVGLDMVEKGIFLDIACFCRLDNSKLIIELLYSSEVCTRIVIDVLVEKSLLTISSKNHIGMHDLIREMGCEIVRRESYKEPGGRSRLWLRNDIFHIFTKNTGTEATEGIYLDLREFEEAEWNLEAFSKMCNLRLLYIHNLRLLAGPKYLPNALRVLKWSWYPSKSLPQGFQPDELTVLSLLQSKLDHLWSGIKYLSKLKSIDLCYSLNLTRTPDFTGIQNLEKLILEGCTNLVMIHSSIAFLKRLKTLNLRECRSIKSLPSELQMDSLETFILSGCSKLKVIPDFGGQMKNLSKLYLSRTAIEKLPSSIETFSESLEELDLSGIILRELPYSLFLKKKLNLSSIWGSNGQPPRSWYSFLPSDLFSKMTPHSLSPVLASLKQFSSLTELNLNDCNLCEGELPSDIGCLSSLQRLHLAGNSFVTLPGSIQRLARLRSINLENCPMLQQIPDLPINDLSSVNMRNCTSLKMFPDLSDLCRKWFFWFSCTNCFSMVGIQDSSHIFYSTLKQWLETLVSHPPSPVSVPNREWKPVVHPLENPRYRMLVVTIRGREIPEWFSNRSTRNSVTEVVARDSKWVGLAVCFLIVPHDNLSAIEEELGANDWGVMGCRIRMNKSIPDLCMEFELRAKRIGSDHLLISFFSKEFWPYNYDDWIQRKHVFKCTQHVDYPGFVKAKECGVRTLYEHDMEEIISKMNQSSSAVSLRNSTDISPCDIDKSAYEQVGTITDEASTSGTGGCDDNYYSAEE